MTLKVINSPFSEKQVKLLNELLPHLTHEQKIWLNGYLSAPNAAVEVTVDEKEQEKPLESKTITATVLYGSQTGNSQSLAEKFSQQLKENQVDVTISSLADFPTKNLKKIDHLIIITSTHGDGEPPDNAIPFYDFLHSKRAPKLDHLQYAVLALGDSSYEYFCKAGADIDEQLKKLGASPLIERADCDLDFHDDAQNWFTQLQQELLKSSVKTDSVQNVSTKMEPSSAYDRQNPFQAKVLEKINLNMDGSNKETYHLELSIEGSGLAFEPGDSLGIYPKNNLALVTQLLNALNFEKDTQVKFDGKTESLLSTLWNRAEMTVLSKPLLQKITNFTESERLAELLANDGWKDYVIGRDLLDVVEDFAPFTWTAQQFVELLRKIPPRLYSIASSYEANPDEVHLTIGRVQYDSYDRTRFGVCSNSIAEEIEIGDTLPVFVQHNPNFKLPEDPQTPIILIGAGTGVAPFRSFIEQREEIEAKGDAWLFFGDQHFVTDFLYQIEWQRWLKEGYLTKMNVAFSRDTEQKVYVQHRLKENAAEVYKWIEKGAVIYVCGDEKTMAHDVDVTLQEILAEQGGQSAEEAAKALKTLQQQKRYQRDVY
ncbi:assimilatory sulfite reductase (NADPH) flavoprotein subunit [Rummeliibacillus suwonensis]|uniref:assimilatory sulfite reductase (NADPH) flavoprotein subunit n=1 Tax=Rummeliibacillus suwonensis TaxID=1306154 RepID=UPI00289D626C|nr:assimilatory sulfite reductase (NADPH) flavoprotein subunit [Rummeliibacillus suwonensis]